MRIIAGRFRSRKLHSPPGASLTRPTPDRLRESLFSILAPRIEGCTFIDAFAGTGAVGLEALSRGARHVIFIERSPTAISVLQENIRDLGVGGEVTIRRGNASRLIAAQEADILFFDPPYDRPGEYEVLLSAASVSLAVAQHDRRLDLAERYGSLARVRTVRQGDNVLSFYQGEDTRKL